MAFLPWLLFPGVAIATALLWLLLRSEQPGLSKASLALALVASALAVYEVIALKTLANIRIDLLLTLPAVSAAAVVIGVLAWRRAPGTAKLSGISLAIIGGAAFAWFAVVFGRGLIESAELSRRFSSGNRLFWEETRRCQSTFVSRFGKLDRRDRRCFGNLRVVSSDGAYPFSRIVVNDGLDVYLMYSGEKDLESVYGMEDSWPIRGRVDEDKLIAEGPVFNGGLRMELRESADGSCSASVVTANGKQQKLQLQREELPACDVETGPVRFVGAWGKVEPLGTQHQRLVQLWLWDSGGKAWGLLVQSDGVRGEERRFNFLKRLHGIRQSADRYDLESYSERYGSGTLTVFTSGEEARIEGTAIAGAQKTFILPPGEHIGHAKIRLLPLRDVDRFAAYFQNVLEAVHLIWTAPR